MASSQPTNDLAATLDGDGVALGVLDNTYSPTLVEFYGELGLDFVWLDFEHGGADPWDAGTVENLLRAAERTGIEPLVRLPDTDPTLVRKALDLGVRSLFLPRVETAAEVREAVRSARFRYDGGPGDRGLAAPRARRWGLAEDYVATEDRETLVGVTVENEASVGNIAEILDVPELGFVFIGPFDLSVSLGHPGEIDHPDVQAAVETVRSKAVDAGVPVGGLGFGVEDVNEKAANGYAMLTSGARPPRWREPSRTGSTPTRATGGRRVTARRQNNSPAGSRGNPLCLRPTVRRSVAGASRTADEPLPPDRRWVRTRVWGTPLSLPTLRRCMSDVTLDDRGRLTLPKEVRERHGDRYYIVELHDGIKLIPVAEDPLDALRDEFAGVEKTADELREEAREVALDEAGR